MNNILLSFNSFLSWLMKLSLLILLPYELLAGNLLMFLGIVIALGISITPIIVFKDYNHHLPRTIDFLVTLSLYLYFVGVSMGFYQSTTGWTKWWSQMTHFLGTAIIALLAFMIVYTLHFVKKIKMSIPLIGLFTFVTALAIGALWEVGEFYFDAIFGTQAIPSIEDTIQDLVFDTLGGSIIAILGMFYVANHESKILKLHLRPMLKIVKRR